MQGIFLLTVTFTLLLLTNFNFQNPISILTDPPYEDNLNDTLSAYFPSVVMCEISFFMTNLKPQKMTTVREVLTSQRNMFAHVMLAYFEFEFILRLHHTSL